MFEFIFITIFAICFAYLAWRDLKLALALIVFLLPAYLLRFQVWFIPMTILELMILIVFGAFVWLRITNRYECTNDKLSFSSYKWLILALIFFSTIAVFVSSNKLASLGVWKAYFIEPILFFIVFINTIKTKKDLKRIFIALGLSAIIVSAFAIFQKFTGLFIYNAEWQAEATRRVTSFFGYPNAVGLYLAPIVVLFAGIALQKLQKITKVTKMDGLQIFGCAAVIILGGMAIWFAKSEGAMAGVAFGLIFLGLFFKKLRSATLIFLACCLLAFIFIPQVNHFIIEKATLGDYSGNIRVIIWQETIQMLEQSPIFGVGLSNFQTAIQPFHHTFRLYEIYFYPHNIILNFWTEIGVLGLLTMILLVIKIFTNYLKVKNEENKGLYLILLCVMIAILVHGLVDVPYFKNDLAVLWWLIFGVSNILLYNKDILKA